MRARLCSMPHRICAANANTPTIAFVNVKMLVCTTREQWINGTKPNAATCAPWFGTSPEGGHGAHTGCGDGSFLSRSMRVWVWRPHSMWRRCFCIRNCSDHAKRRQCCAPLQNEPDCSHQPCAGRGELECERTSRHTFNPRTVERLCCRGWHTSHLEAQRQPRKLACPWCCASRLPACTASVAWLNVSEQHVFRIDQALAVTRARRTAMHVRPSVGERNRTCARCLCARCLCECVAV